MSPYPSRRYGPWALVAGASEGLGEAFARSLAARGMNLVLVARRRELLESLARTLRGGFGIEVLPLVLDLAAPDFADRLSVSIAHLELGLAVYNAAFAPLGFFAEQEGDDLLRVLDVNVRGPLLLLRKLLPPMIARGRGAIILMSSLAGNQGSPGIAAYAASKAFSRVLAESLWGELGGRGIDLVACCAGAVRTPGFARSSVREAPGTLDPGRVAEAALRALGRGPLVVPGIVNKMAAFLMGRLLPRRAAIRIMAGSMKGTLDDRGGETAS